MNSKFMNSSYKDDDVTILLKNINGLVTPLNIEERETLIQKGGHYSEMLPVEYTPSPEYMKIYEMALDNYSQNVSDAVATLSNKIIKAKGESVILVSLARAGIPAGILVKRYLEKFYKINVPHYGISIIRDRGIDHVAMKYILESNENARENILFIDGWIGKGAILNQLKEAIDLNPEYKGISSELAVIADPAHLVDLAGTYNDILIPSSCLNATVSGLISRTFLREDVISKDDFHGSLFYDNLLDEDVSNDFINTIESKFTKDFTETLKPSFNGISEVRLIAEEFNITNINHIKPSIGETTRVLLRRVPWKILISEDYKDKEIIKHILKLAQEKDVEIIYYPLKCYVACGLIKKIADI